MCTLPQGAKNSLPSKTNQDYLKEAEVIVNAKFEVECDLWLDEEEIGEVLFLTKFVERVQGLSS